MESNQFRIGNLLQDREGKTAVIEKITKDNLQAFSGMITPLPLSPIPLTEEWLLRFGFEEMEDYFRLILPKFGEIAYNGKQIAFVNNHNWFYFPNETFYVHSLQNLIHALTGEELTLKQ